MARCRQCGHFGYINKGEDICGSCKADNEFNEKAINQLIKEGHPYHCACRQVWGDGVCECHLYHVGYEPYGWLKSIYGIGKEED